MPDRAASPHATALLTAFIGTSKDHAFICMDPQGVVIAWNDGAAGVFGYSADEAIGMPLSVLFTGEDRAKGLDRYELAVAARDSRSEDDRWHLRKDGTRIWVTGTVEAIRSPEGQLMGFVKVARDRTDMRAQIEHLQQAAEHSRSFFRTLGHELRNALFPLNSVSALMRRSADAERLAPAMGIMSNQVALLAGMADDLVNVERLERGTLELQMVPSDLRDFLQGMVGSFEAQAQEKGLRLQAILPEGPLVADIDRPRLQQVIVNLLSNAIKYTPPGGTVFVKATHETNEVVLRVEDTGIGIAPAMLPRIFELFTRAPTATEMEPGGLGVGLTLVKQLVELHGGTVQARSAGEGQGAEFSVRLPATLVPADGRKS